MSQQLNDLSRRSFVVGALSLPFALAACGGTGTQSASQDDAGDAGSDTAAAGSGTPAEGEGPVVNGILVAPYDNGFSEGTHHATIEVQDYGTIKLELNANNTPITVSNFAQLVSEGFYDGLTFHRIMAGFMIQGGDPLGNGTGGSSIKIKGEFSENGVANVIQHKRGVISMARATPYDSASSQFFIMHADADYLDGQYAAFGHVTEGMEVVDAIATSVPVIDNNGTVEAAYQPVITSITMDD